MIWNKAVKGSNKRKIDVNKNNGNKRIMNFDFWVDKSNINKSAEKNNTESNENIIVDAFTLNAASPSTINSKLKPYINYEDFDTNQK